MPLILRWYPGLCQLDRLGADRPPQRDTGAYRWVKHGRHGSTTNPLAGLTSLASQGFLIGLLRTLTITPDPSNPNSTVQILNIPLLLRAFQGDTDVNILSTPNLLTTDNEEAEIIIGEQRPSCVRRKTHL